MNTPAKPHFLICPDSFKEVLPAHKAAQIMADTIQSCFPGNTVKTTQIPLADGGEGTARLLTGYLGGTIKYTHVTGPLRNNIRSWLGYNHSTRTACLEMAAASGLELISSAKRDPLYTTTYGVGELICRALDMGAQKIFIGLGGSATVDAGIGMAQALGARFYDNDNRFIDVAQGGHTLQKIRYIDLKPLSNICKNVEFICLSDVKTLLKDCVPVFAPQKGARTEKQLHTLQKGMESFFLKAQHNNGPQDFQGAGAAGALGYGCRFFLNAAVQPGARTLLDLIDFQTAAASADYIITGEGTFDAQSLKGKTIGSLIQYLTEHNLYKPIIILCGQVKDMDQLLKKQKKYPWTVYPIINVPDNLQKQLADTKENLRFRLINLMHFIQNKVE